MEESIAKGKKAKKDMSVLEKFIDRNGADSPIPSIMASDMLLAGIETTGNPLGFLLYNLATNPNKQAGLGKVFCKRKKPETRTDAKMNTNKI